MTGASSTKRSADCERILAATRSDLEAGTPILMLEPACASVFKDELLNLFPNREDARRLSRQTRYIADFVAQSVDRFPRFLKGGSALVQPHCHHHAVIGFGSELALFDHLGLDVERPPQGCCGMAGGFGMAIETFEVARAIGERVLLPRVRELDSGYDYRRRRIQLPRADRVQRRPQDHARRRTPARAHAMNAGLARPRLDRG